MFALGLVIAIFCFWSLLGFTIVSALYAHRNLLQNALLAPITGTGATVLSVMADCIASTWEAGEITFLIGAVS